MHKDSYNTSLWLVFIIVIRTSDVALIDTNTRAVLSGSDSFFIVCFDIDCQDQPRDFKLQITGRLCRSIYFWCVDLLF
jgi:hypothetical protein